MLASELIAIIIGMGLCRGSGVVTKDSHGEWKVKHYVLSDTVPNDDIKEFMKIGEN